MIVSIEGESMNIDFLVHIDEANRHSVIAALQSVLDGNALSEFNKSLQEFLCNENAYYEELCASYADAENDYLDMQNELLEKDIYCSDAPF
jgi:hypothetical protein